MAIFGTEVSAFPAPTPSPRVNLFPTADVAIFGTLRAVRESGEPVEILLREELVAYLTAAGEPASHVRELEALSAALDSAGLKLKVDQAPAALRPWPQPVPQPTPDGRDDIESVLKMRSERDW